MKNVVSWFYPGDLCGQLQPLMSVNKLLKIPGGKNIIADCYRKPSNNMFWYNQVSTRIKTCMTEVSDVEEDAREELSFQKSSITSALYSTRETRKTWTSNQK